jgi:hypothetical protein
VLEVITPLPSYLYKDFGTRKSTGCGARLVDDKETGPHGADGQTG